MINNMEYSYKMKMVRFGSNVMLRFSKNVHSVKMKISLEVRMQTEDWSWELGLGEAQRQEGPKQRRKEVRRSL
jgi:hypothetical protein